jgi:hypothetical protein
MQKTTYIIALMVFLIIVMILSPGQPWILLLSMLIVMLIGIIQLARPAKSDRHGYRLLLILFLIIIFVFTLITLYMDLAFSDFTM